MVDHVFDNSNIYQRVTKSSNKKMPTKKFLVQPGFEHGAPNPESAMLTPQPQIIRNCRKNEEFQKTI